MLKKNNTQQLSIHQQSTTILQFKNVIGNQFIQQKLAKGVDENRIHHAQLFLGAAGSDNLALALAYAQYIHCRNRQNGDSCGVCTACTKSQKMIHPDIHYTYPTIGTKAKSTDFVKEWRKAVLENPYMTAYQWLQHLEAENKQGNITTAECDAIVQKLSMKAFESPYKVLIIWMPEYLGKEGNRLLKIIEEPPANTIFLLVAANADLILNTILSRVQMVKVSRLGDDELSVALQERFDLSAAKAGQLAALAEGNFNEALKLIDHAQEDNQQLLIQWFSSCIKRQVVKTDGLIEQIATKGRENQKNFLRYCLFFMRQCMVFRILPNSSQLLHKTEQAIAGHLADKWSLQHFEELIDWLEKATYHIERNANPRILFCNFSLKISDIYRKSI